MAVSRKRAFCSMLLLLVQGTNASPEDCKDMIKTNDGMSLQQCMGTCKCWSDDFSQVSWAMTDYEDLGHFILATEVGHGKLDLQYEECEAKCLGTDGNGGLRLKSVEVMYNVRNGILDCKDYRDHCAKRAREGECSKDPRYMHLYCKYSCGKCHNVCEDKEPDCLPKAKPPGGCDDEQVANICPNSCKTCAEAGHWSPWVNHGSCSRTCGGGEVYQIRSCYRRAFHLLPREQIDHEHCKLGMNQTKAICNRQECPTVYKAKENAAGQMAPNVLVAVLMCCVALVA